MMASWISFQQILFYSVSTNLPKSLLDYIINEYLFFFSLRSQIPTMDIFIRIFCVVSNKSHPRLP